MQDSATAGHEEFLRKKALIGPYCIFYLNVFQTANNSSKEGAETVKLPDMSGMSGSLRPERQPHLMPCHISVGGGRHSLVLEAERGIVSDKSFLAGQHHAESALSAGAAAPRILFGALPIKRNS